MTALLSRLAEIGLTVVEVLLVIGFVVSLVKVLTGHYEGCAPLVAILIAVLLLELWRGGALVPLVQGLVQPLLPGAIVVPGLGGRS